MFMKSIVSLLTIHKVSAIMLDKSAWEKAMTETSSISIADRESIIWWKMFMWSVCENHS